MRANGAKALDIPLGEKWLELAMKNRSRSREILNLNDVKPEAYTKGSTVRAEREKTFILRSGSQTLLLAR